MSIQQLADLNQPQRDHFAFVLYGVKNAVLSLCYALSGRELNGVQA